MRLYFKCSGCTKETSFVKFVESRAEFAQAYGEKPDLLCKHCNTNQIVHVNEIYARKSMLTAIISLGIFLIATPIVFYLTWPFIGHWLFWMGPAGLILIPGTIYAILSNYDQMRVSAFNRYRLSE